MGFPMIPRGVDKSRLKLLAMRVKESARVPGVSDVFEWYYTDTGEAVPEDPPAAEGKSRWLRRRRPNREDIDDAGEA